MIIYGSNFGTDPSLVSVKVGGKDAIVEASGFSSPILAVKFLETNRACVAKVGVLHQKKRLLFQEALSEISLILFLHKENFSSSTSLMPHK